MKFFGEEIPAEIEEMRISESIYRVPIEKITFAGTSNGGFMQGGQKTYTLVAANSEVETLINLSRLDSFGPKWNELSPEKRPENPFRFREGKIEKELDCPIRYDSNSGWIFCGPPTIGYDTLDKNATNGYFGGCCLEGSDNDENSFCPYYKKMKLEEIGEDILKPNEEKSFYLNAIYKIDTTGNKELGKMKFSLLSKLQ